MMSTKLSACLHDIFVCLAVQSYLKCHPSLLTHNVIGFFNAQLLEISVSIIIKDWSEMVWLLEILCFKNQPCSRLYLKKTAGMHWFDAVSWLNEAKTRIFQPTANFENFEIYLYFVCQPAIRPGCTRCRAPEISHNKGNGGGFTKMLFQR